MISDPRRPLSFINRGPRGDLRALTELPFTQIESPCADHPGRGRFFGAEAMIPGGMV